MKRIVILIFSFIAIAANAQSQNNVESQLRSLAISKEGEVVSVARLHAIIDSLAVQGNMQVKPKAAGRTLYLSIDTTARAEDVSVSSSEVYNMEDYDTVRVRLGRREMYVVRKGKVERLEPADYSYSYDGDDEEDGDVTINIYGDNKSFTRFRVYAWDGVEWGVNGFMQNYSASLDDELGWLDLKQGRSWNFNINIWSFGVALGTPHVGLLTGIGLAFNNYHFSTRYTLGLDAHGHTVPDSSYLNESVYRNKLSTFGITMPLMFEFHIPVHRKTLFVACGVIGDVRLGGRTKVKYTSIDDEPKVRINNDDFNLNTFRYHLTARVGYRYGYVFANYSPVSIFERGKGPKLNTFAIGLGLAF